MKHLDNDQDLGYSFELLYGRVLLLILIIMHYSWIWLRRTMISAGWHAEYLKIAPLFCDNTSPADEGVFQNAPLPAKYGQDSAYSLPREV